YNKLKTEGIGISTVYRNINLFVDLDILKEFKIDETSYYELKMYAKKPLHIHFKCEECENLIDIKDRDIILKYLKINNSIEKKYGIQINDLDIMFHGLCSNCIDKKLKAVK
ncbi:Fur family transcriptional regulator, partial [Schnuerera sp.]|uniref:Fur family transcriptional regulator n=1 Tax=Schnuerera sp. TaxID=2794844 RepID=UPI002C199A7E